MAPIYKPKEKPNQMAPIYKPKEKTKPNGAFINLKKKPNQMAPMCICKPKEIFFTFKYNFDTL